MKKIALAIFNDNYSLFIIHYSLKKEKCVYSNKTRVCPFFTSDDRCVIRCEGGTRIKFPDSITTIDYTDRYCGDMDGWKTCTYARQLLDYYDKKNQKENQSEKEKNA